MPLIYGPTEMTNPQPKNFVTPSRTTGIYVQNVSPLALIITSGLGNIELPPWQTATLEMMPNDNMNVSAIPITAVPPALAAYAYVDISYTFQGVTVQGSGLFFPFMTPGGDAVAAGIMGPDGLQVGTSTSNPNGSSLLVQATGSSVIGPTQIINYAYSDLPAVGQYKFYEGIGALNRAAARRAVTIFNNTDAVIMVPAGGVGTYEGVSGTNPYTLGGNPSEVDIPAGDSCTFAYNIVTEMNDPVNSLDIAVGWKTAAGTTGNITAVVTEAMG